MPLGPSLLGRLPLGRLPPGFLPLGPSLLGRLLLGRLPPSGRESRGRGSSGRGAPGRGSPGRGTPGRGSSGRGAPGRGSPGREFPGRGSLGRGCPSYLLVFENENSGKFTILIPNPTYLAYAGERGERHERRRFFLFLDKIRFCFIASDDARGAYLRIVGVARAGGWVSACQLAGRPALALVLVYD